MTEAKFVIVLFGASGDLARRKTVPALFSLWLNERVTSFRLVGYARTPLTVAEWKIKCLPHLKRMANATDQLIDAFFEQPRVQYVAGAYDQVKDVRRVLIEDHEHRIFYLALPPSQFAGVALAIKQSLYADHRTNRLVVEKPFGRDLQSSQGLLDLLGSLFREDQVYRIDHYLGKEMVRSLLVLRFANVLFESVWDCKRIANVQIVFKETLGVEGRGGYFDEYGIVRDVLQNHLLQILSLIAMERPADLTADCIRDEKVRVLQCVRPLDALADVVLGQYTANNSHPGYAQEDTVPSDSLAPTFCSTVLHVDNDRWRGVPFVLKCGKGLDVQKSEVRVQFRDVPACIFGDACPRNELVLRVQPNESIYVKLLTKRPGLEDMPIMTDLDLSYHSRYPSPSVSYPSSTSN
jgi:glucose-6-phosphate 1-dehydrogenase